MYLLSYEANHQLAPMNNHDIIKIFLPKQLDIRRLNSLESVLKESNIINKAIS